MKLHSDFALLSVKAGREDLAAQSNLRIPVTIVGYIDGIWGHDDGIDQEFTVTVEHISTATPNVIHTVASNRGVKDFDNLPDAIDRARAERATDRKSSISRSIMVHESLYTSQEDLP